MVILCLIPGIKGLITSSRKRRYYGHEHSAKHFEDDKGDERDFSGILSDGKNPWGNLAKSWSKLDRNRSRGKPGRLNCFSRSESGCLTFLYDKNIHTLWQRTYHNGYNLGYVCNSSFRTAVWGMLWLCVTIFVHVSHVCV
jgi:hypothetical protein